MKLFYFWPCSIFILVFFFSKEGVCQSPYYQGKTITFMQGRDPGGVGDLRNKVMFQFMQKYIPGHPTIISEYMPGGGGRRVGGQSVGHVQFIRSRLFAWLLGPKEPRFVVGYAGAELDLALERGEIDSRAAALERETMSEEYKKIADFHAILEIPKGSRPPVFAGLPEVGTFTHSQLERDVLAMSRTFWGAGTLIFLPPNTPEDLVRTVRQAIRKSFEDREFHEAYKKLLGVEPTPLMPEDQQKLVADLPRDPEVGKVFAAIADMAPLPPRR